MGRRAAEFAENAKRKPANAPPQTKRRKRETDEDSDDEEAMVPEALTRKIISQARQQQEEMDMEDTPSRAQPRRGVSFAPLATEGAAAGAGGGDGDDDDDDEDGGEEEEVTAEYYEVEDVELDEGDERALDLFMGNRAPQTLADIIMEKIAQHQESAEARSTAEPGEGSGMPVMPELPPKVIEVYQGVGRLLSTYRSGKLPKAFKIIPQLTNWEEILYVTQPEEWRPAVPQHVERRLGGAPFW